jgi:GxxExxY protein
VDTKVVDAIADVHVAQMMNYLAITGLKLGIIINFKNPKLEYRRVVR